MWYHLFGQIKIVMKKTTITVLVFLVASLFCFAQINRQENSIAISSLNNIPQERIFLHYNTSLLFSGEQFLYKIYCFNNESKRLSTISKIGYIELIAKDKSIVFSHKIRLDAGLGHGDFFIPTNVPTGSYKLFAYTQWMKNNGVESFFEADLVIINPYQKIPKDYLEQSIDTVLNKDTSVVKALGQTTALSADLDEILSLDKTEIGKRKKLTLTINTKDFTSGNYSLSVRKQNELISDKSQSSIGFFEGYKNLKNHKEKENKKVFYLPELRGELITGIMTDKDNNTPVSGEKIALSFPGDNYLFNISTTDDSGRFYFNLDTPRDNSNVILQHLSEDWENTDISFDKNQVDYNELQFKSFQLNSDMKEQIEERSIQNQIENAYVSLKLDDTSIIKQKSAFYREFEISYDLDDYTRFNSIKETIIEIVNQVSVRKTADGYREFQVRPKAGFQDIGLSTLLFVDGLFVKKHEDFMDYSAKKIKTISFSQEKYLMGSLFFQGILSITTIDGNFYENFNADYQKKINLFEPEKNKIYFKQDYGVDTNSTWDRIPDFRRQLLWIPSMTLKDTEVLEIYSSDVIGDYRIYLEGFSSKGDPISVSKTFRVE